jgi:general secretion pathway protein H
MIPKSGHRGFTLVEMLVVLLIFGLLAGLVSAIARPDERGMLRIEAERLAQLLELAIAESQVTGRSIGWSADGPTYRFWRVSEEGGWSEIRDSDLLRARALPQGMMISGLRIENMRPQGVMQIEFTPYAPPLFFGVEMSLGAARYAVVAAANGDVRATSGDANTYGANAF